MSTKNNNNKRNIIDLSGYVLNEYKENRQALKMNRFERIEWLTHLQRFVHPVDIMLFQDRTDLFLCFRRSYIEPLALLVRKNKCNMYASKLILHFLWPAHHMSDDVDYAWSDLDYEVYHKQEDKDEAEYTYEDYEMSHYKCSFNDPVYLLV